MIVNELLNPNSIVVIGGSNDPGKPGGRILKNIIDGAYDGELFVVNPKENEVQGQKCFKTVEELPQVDLAIMAIPAKLCVDAVKILTETKGTKAFIILSAGFSEVGHEGKELEDKLVSYIDKVGGCLIGPNCIGVLSTRYKGVFAGPIPKLEANGCDFVSGSGATAVFILEVAIPRGLTFASLFSVGNSAQIGVEDVLEYWDETFDPATSSKVKLIYIEEVANPEKLLKHASSLIRKGCKIAAIKAGTTEAGSRAVSSHTGALAGSDLPVEALMKKAGIVRCYSRTELVDVAQIMMHKELKGNNIAIITHAGGPGVLLTDTLDKNGMKVPKIEGDAANELLGKLFHGSSVANPIDFLATGNAEQLGDILDYVENRFDNIDGAAVIFGTTGMFDVSPVYDVLSAKMDECKKPIYGILPSPVQAGEAIAHFQSLGKTNFSDESYFGAALARVFNTPKPAESFELPTIDIAKIRNVIDNAENGYLNPIKVQELLDAAGIPRAKEFETSSKSEAVSAANELGFPLVMKVIGPVHKSDVGGVKLNIKSIAEVESVFDEMMKIKDASGVLVQPMLSGIELFVGAKREGKFGHLILCGLGGIFIEVLKDVAYGLCPISPAEADSMIKSIKAYGIIKGARGKEGANEAIFSDVIVRLSALLQNAPEIFEMDINPLLGTAKAVVAVDARIRIEK